MATQVQWRRGTHAQVASFTGAAGEIVVDLTQNRVVVQDGTTTGGWPGAKQNGDTLAPQQINETEVTGVASAATVDIGGQPGNYIQITGTTAITSFGNSLGSAAGAERVVVFTGILTLTNSASLILPGGGNIATGAGDVVTLRYEGSGTWRVTDYTRASGAALVNSSAPILGYIFGLGLSNDGGTPNTKIDVAGGAAADTTAAVLMSLSSPHVVDFTVTGANGLDTGSIAASTWYAIVLMQGTAGIAVMATKETAGSSISPTLPSGYSFYRYIGSVKTDGSSNLLAFKQAGQLFTWNVSVIDFSGAFPSSATLLTLTVPRSVVVYPSVAFPASSGSVKISSNNFLTVLDYSSGQPPMFVANTNPALSTGYIPTNTSAQIYYAGNISGQIFTQGWIDPHVAGVT